MARYQDVGRLEEFPDGGMKQVVVDGELVGVYRVGFDVYAISDVCTHEEAYLTEGDFDEDELEVECPLHGSCFNVVSGEVRILPATKPVSVYEVTVDDGVVNVGPRKIT